METTWILPSIPLAEVTVSFRLAVLLGIVLVVGLLGVLVILALAWVRRRQARRATRPADPQGRLKDPWREAARRTEPDPDDGEPWPPVDPREPRS